MLCGVMSTADHPPGHPAPAAGVYRLLNVFGTETEAAAHVAQGQPLPPAPWGYNWRLERLTGNAEA
jgi:hypothetical protein